MLKLDEDHRPEDAYVYVDVGQKEKPTKRHSCPLEQLETTLETDHRGFLQSDGGQPFDSNTVIHMYIANDKSKHLYVLLSLPTLPLFAPQAREVSACVISIDMRKLVWMEDAVN